MRVLGAEARSWIDMTVKDSTVRDRTTEEGSYGNSEAQFPSQQS